MPKQEKKSVCIIVFSEVIRDARILRQIKYLSPHYKLTIIGLGDGDPAWDSIPDFIWKSVGPGTTPPFSLSFIKKAFIAWLMFFGKVVPVFYEWSYWLIQSYFSEALRIATENKYDIIYANDWNTLPIAVKAAGKNNSKVVFDAHEYGPLESSKILFKLLVAPVIVYILKRNKPFIDASITVGSALAEKYREEFGIDPVVVMNAPEEKRITSHEIDPEHVHLIHHGIAAPSRKLEDMIYMVAFADRRYSLHLMLMGNPEYVLKLTQLANQIAPGRIIFEDTVNPEVIVERISEFDIGLCIVEPNSNFNTTFSLPNKFFDFITAGLAVCIGPYPEMGKIVQQYKIGCISSTFKPEDVARTLSQLTKQQIEEMKTASLKAAKELNASNEMKKVIDLLEKLDIYADECPIINDTPVS